MQRPEPRCLTIWPVTTLRTALRDCLVVAASVGAAVLAAFAVDRLAGVSAPYVPFAAAVVVGAAFWWRPPLGILAFAMFALLAGTLEHWVDLDLLLFDEIGILVLLAIAVAARYVRFGRPRVGWLEWSLAVLVAAAIASSVWNGIPAVTWLAGLFLLLKAVAFFYLLRLLALNDADVEGIGIVVLLVAGAIGVLGLVEWLDPVTFQRALNLPTYELSRAEVPIVRSIFLHPALYGWLTAFGSLLCYARFLTHRSWWSLPAGLMLNAGTFLSGRRTPMLGVGLAIAVGLLWLTLRMGLRRAATRIWLPAAIVVVVAIVMLAPAIGRLAQLTAEEYGPSIEVAQEIFRDDPRSEVVATVHPRIALYAASLAIGRDEFPLGAGIGQFGSHLSRDDYSPLYERYGLNQVALLRPDDPQAATDAFWPMVLGETGWIGLVAGMCFFGGIAIALWQAASAAPTGRRRLIALAALFVFLEGLVRSATSSVFVAPPIAYFVLGAAGLALGASDHDPADAEEPSTPV